MSETVAMNNACIMALADELGEKLDDLIEEKLSEFKTVYSHLLGSPEDRLKAFKKCYPDLDVTFGQITELISINGHLVHHEVWKAYRALMAENKMLSDELTRREQIEGES